MNGNKKWLRFSVMFWGIQRILFFKILPIFLDKELVLHNSKLLDLSGLLHRYFSHVCIGCNAILIIQF